MSNRKSIYYRLSKLVANQNGIQPPPWRTSTTASLRTFYTQQSNINRNRMNNQLTRIHQRYRPLPFLNQIQNRPLFQRNPARNYFKIKFEYQTPEEFKAQMEVMMNDSNYFVSILDDNNRPIHIHRIPYINKHMKFRPYYELIKTLEAILGNTEEYSISTSYITVLFHEEINVNPMLVRQRHSITELNCAVKIVLDLLQSRKEGARNARRIKHVMKINETYFQSGINNEGLQLLADRSELHLIVKDKLRHIWHEFKPKTKSHPQKILMFSHNNHLAHQRP